MMKFYITELTFKGYSLNLKIDGPGNITYEAYFIAVDPSVVTLNGISQIGG